MIVTIGGGGVRARGGGENDPKGVGSHVEVDGAYIDACSGGCGGAYTNDDDGCGVE